MAADGIDGLMSCIFVLLLLLLTIPELITQMRESIETRSLAL